MAIPMDGFCATGFEAVRDGLIENLSDLDVGASVAVTVEGEFVVDLWGGYATADRARPWQRDTLVNVYSSTKIMTALCALVLADRGQLDLNAPVAEYWPEFAANGKARVRVRHLLGHTAGLSGFEGPTDAALLYDWNAACNRLAAQAPWWEAGTACGYHAITQGYLIGEVVRRITGRSLGTYFRDEIAAPLGADFHIGLPEAHFDRVAELIPPDMDPEQLIAPEPGSIAERTLLGTPTEVSWTATAAWRSAEIPAANGHGNARSMARVQSVVTNGGAAFGSRLLSPAGCERIFDEQANGVDLLLGLPVRYGMGYGIVNETFPLSANARTCFWGGYGGSLVVVDLDARVCFAYAMNRMLAGTVVGDVRSQRLLAAVYATLSG